MSKQYVIYVLKNTVSDKSYYGYCLACDVEAAAMYTLSNNISPKSLSHLLNSYKKYGPDAFIVTEIATANDDTTAAIICEQLANKYDTYCTSYGYNYGTAQLIDDFAAKRFTEDEKTQEKDNSVDFSNTISLYDAANAIQNAAEHFYCMTSDYDDGYFDDVIKEYNDFLDSLGIEYDKPDLKAMAKEAINKARNILVGKLQEL